MSSALDRSVAWTTATFAVAGHDDGMAEFERIRGAHYRPDCSQLFAAIRRATLDLHLDHLHHDGHADHGWLQVCELNNRRPVFAPALIAFLACERRAAIEY